MSELALKPLLADVAKQAASADESRSVDASVIQALKSNPIMSFTASENIGGLNQSIQRCGDELAVLAAACPSTAWVLWNHLCTFHLFAGLLGPDNQSQLQQIVEAREWVCFPAGASTGIQGKVVGDEIILNGKAAFGSGARYAEYAGASFMIEGHDAPSFSLVDLRQDGVEVDPDWRAMSLRASATDTVYYRDARVTSEHVVPFLFMYRKAFRQPDFAVVHHRYREDWVALSDIWLAYMACGHLQNTLDGVVEGIRDRIAIVGVKVAERPTVHVNLGHAQAKINAARDTAQAVAKETDERISAEMIPTEADYLRQTGAAMTALSLCGEALQLLQRIMGGNGLREGAIFERQVRDFQAMPLHINAHPDRVSEQVGRNLLGLETENPF